MTKNELMNKATRTFYRAGFKLKKHSPEILAVVGVAGVVTSTVMACKATTKLGDILDKAKSDIDVIHNSTDKTFDLVDGTVEHYTQDDAKKDLTIIYTRTGVELVKLYAPAVAVGTLSIAAMLTGHNILRKRNMALAAAYATVDKGFKEYRGRVIERFGEALDKELKYNIREEEVTRTIIDENGEEQTVTETVTTMDNPTLYSEFARFYDDGCTGWTKDPEYNLMFLKRQQDYANDKLKAQGYLFLNDVYDMLGIPKTKAGQVVGWIYDETISVGDNYVDFGIFNIDSERARAFVNGKERVILLDFNVDGNILEYL